MDWRTRGRVKASVVTTTFSMTGVPLAQLRLARALARRGHDVELVYGSIAPDLVAAGTSGPPPVDGVRTLILGHDRARHLVGPLRRYLRQRRPDVLFTAEDHLNGAALLAAILARSPVKISASSRVSPFDSYANAPTSRKWLAKQAMRGVMWRADALTCVSRDMVDEYRTIFPHGRHTWAYNIIDDPETRERMQEPVDHPWFVSRDRPLIVSAGTLTRRKNFPLLLDAFRLLSEGGTAARLAIFGEGHQRPVLEEMAARHGLADRIWLAGRVDNPLRYFARADVIALTSRAEGLPNVLIEGMVAGCTPVAVDCPTGPREVLGAGDVGFLVRNDDPRALAGALAQALARPDQPAARARVLTQFTADAVLARHAELLAMPELAA
jgi:glycosyltransferase involved in cell wall biosynthesis